LLFKELIKVMQDSIVSVSKTTQTRKICSSLPLLPVLVVQELPLLHSDHRPLSAASEPPTMPTILPFTPVPLLMSFPATVLPFAIQANTLDQVM